MSKFSIARPSRTAGIFISIAPAAFMSVKKQSRRLILSGVLY